MTYPEERTTSCPPELLREVETLGKWADLTHQLMVRCDTQGRFQAVNRAYARRFGLEPADFVGRRIRDVLGEKGFAAIERYVQAVCAGEPQSFDVLVPYDNLGERWLSC